jgi:multiple sugar transport system permease protein
VRAWDDRNNNVCLNSGKYGIILNSISAYLDGCSRMRALVTIVLPMALPGVVCAILFGFTLCWNEFLYSLVFIQDELHKTLSVGVVTELIHGDIYYWGSLLGACIMGSLPIIVL